MITGPQLVTPEDLRAWIGRRVLLVYTLEEPGTPPPPRRVSLFGEVTRVDGPGAEWRYHVSIGPHTVDLAAGQFCTVQYA